MSTQTEHGYIPAWSLADRLRKARLQVGKTQREFALMLGVGHSAYAQWELGNNGPRDLVGTARKIERLTGVDAAWLVGLTFPGKPEIQLPHLDSNQESCDYLLSA